LISQRAAALLDADDCVIFRLEEDGVSLRPIMGQGEAAEYSMGCPLQVGQGIIGHSVADNKPLMVNYAQHDPRGFHVPGTSVEEEEHLLVTPLSFRGRIIGALLVNRVDKPPFTQEDLRLFNGLAAQIAIAIENARLYEKLERYTHVLESAVEERTAQVQQQARWLETILHTVKDALIVTDCNGTIRMANPSALRIAGQTAAALLGKPVQPVLERLTNGNVSWTDELPAPLRGPVQMGNEHYQYSVATFDDVQTGRSGYVFLLTDVTPLQRLNNLKSQMIRIAAHDLRSPMGNIGLEPITSPTSKERSAS
jgi:PAS domain-containing protein